MNGLSIIVPIKVAKLAYLSGFCECYQKLLTSRALDVSLQLIIPDTSSDDVFDELSKCFHFSNVIHFRPECNSVSGHNGKLISFQAALKYVVYDHVLLLDDDYRPSVQTINVLCISIGEYSCFKCMVSYKDPSTHDLINVCGIFVINLLHPHKQFCGHIGFNLADLLKIGMPETNVLFDELAIELRFRQAGKSVGFKQHVFLEMVTHGTKKFLEQRVRYAYENLAYPQRFLAFLFILPLLLLAFAYRPAIGLLAIGVLSISALLMSLFGQLIYGGGRFHKLTWLLGVVWFWIYPFSTWIAVLLYIRGGIKFGEQRVRRAV